MTKKKRIEHPSVGLASLAQLTGVIFNDGAPFITNMQLYNWQANKARHSQVIKIENHNIYNLL